MDKMNITEPCGCRFVNGWRVVTCARHPRMSGIVLDGYGRRL